MQSYFPFPVEIDRERTTAKHGVHFINNISREYDKREVLVISQEIELIPENIVGEGVQIVYWISQGEFDNVIDTTIIKLIPKKKEQ